MTRPGLASRDDLLGWPSIVADAEFLRLIRRLVWETSPDAVRLGFPAGSGTSAGDWDGSVRTVRGNAFVPAGLSVWELSFEKSGITRKADGDYQKRTSTPDGSPTTYIEAILCPWTKRRAWAAGKLGDGRWNDVRGYGVDEIEEWLEAAPVTHSWISERLGLAPHGYRSGRSSCRAVRCTRRSRPGRAAARSSTPPPCPPRRPPRRCRPPRPTTRPRPDPGPAGRPPGRRASAGGVR